MKHCLLGQVVGMFSFFPFLVEVQQNGEWGAMQLRIPWPLFWLSQTTRCLLLGTAAVSGALVSLVLAFGTGVSLHHCPHSPLLFPLLKRVTKEAPGKVLPVDFC